jgi:hypothetical protein
MDIQPFEYNGKWLLARGVHGLNTSVSNTGSPQDVIPLSDTFVSCWSEQNGWVSSGPLAMVFETADDAAAYLRNNSARLEASR